MPHLSRSHLIIIGWFINNAAAIGLLAFSDVWLLRIVGWLWLSASLSVAGLVEIGGIFGAK